MWNEMQTRRHHGFRLFVKGDQLPADGMGGRFVHPEVQSLALARNRARAREIVLSFVVHYLHRQGDGAFVSHTIIL